MQVLNTLEDRNHIQRSVLNRVRHAVAQDIPGDNFHPCFSVNSVKYLIKVSIPYPFVAKIINEDGFSKTNSRRAGRQQTNSAGHIANRRCSHVLDAFLCHVKVVRLPIHIDSL